MRSSAGRLRLDDLPGDALKRVFQQLSTYERRTASLVSHKWRELIAESWDAIEIRLGGANYLDSASFQIRWLLSLHLQQLRRLCLFLKGVELSGIAVDYLLGPLLDMLEQGRLPQLHTFWLTADMSLPGPLHHSTLQYLFLDIYALTATLHCPQLLELKICTVSMPGPTLFSKDALRPMQQLSRLHLSFQACYVDSPDIGWLVTDGLGLLSALQHAVFIFPKSFDVFVLRKPAFSPTLAHLEIKCRFLLAKPDALLEMMRLPACLLMFARLGTEDTRVVDDFTCIFMSERLLEKKMIRGPNFIQISDGPFECEQLRIVS